MRLHPPDRPSPSAGRRRFLLAAALALVTLPASPLAAQTGEPTGGVGDLSAKAEVVFRGTVRLLNTSTVPADEGVGRSVVRIDEVLSGSETLRRFVGKDVTVRLKEGTTVAAGQTRIFFANVWHFGESLGLIELGSVPAPAAPQARAFREDVVKARQASADRQLKERMEAAQLVVAGRVTAVKARPRILSEHDPQWTEAEIDVSEVVKGTAPANKMTIQFAASDDVMWYRSPKLKAGQEGIWILRSGLAGAGAPQFLGIAEPGDQLPISELNHAKALLQR